MTMTGMTLRPGGAAGELGRCTPLNLPLVVVGYEMGERGSTVIQAVGVLFQWLGPDDVGDSDGDLETPLFCLALLQF